MSSTPPAAPAPAAVPCSGPTLSVCGFTMRAVLRRSTSFGPAYRMQLVCTLVGHKDRVWHGAWHPTQDLLATCSGDCSVRLWAPTAPGGVEWKCVGTADSFSSRTVRSCEWSPDGRQLACASFDAMVTVFTLTSRRELEHLATLEGHENEVKSVAWSATGELLATCSRDKSVWLWEWDDREASFECAAVLHGHTQDVKCVAWHPTRELLLSASYDDSIRAWACTGDDWECIGTLAGHTQTVWSLAFSPAGDLLASVSDDRSIVVWRGTDAPGLRVGGLPVIDGMTWKEEARIADAHAGSVFSIDWMRPQPAGRRGGPSEEDVGAFLERQRAAEGAAGPGAAPAAVPTPPAAAAAAFRPGFVTCGADDAVRVYWQQPESSPPALFDAAYTHAHAHAADVNCVRWHPRDPSLLFTAGDDNVGKLWRWGLPVPVAAVPERRAAVSGV